MKERPILFNGAMVRAILAGQKTQTRRVIKEPNNGVTTLMDNGQPLALDHDDQWVQRPCPYGQPGDRLWVRETWRIGAWDENKGAFAIDYCDGPSRKWLTIPHDDHGDKFQDLWIDCCDELHRKSIHPCNGDYSWEPGSSPLRRRPSIHMPRWASRITLEITDVRVEQVQDISEDDAQAEGFSKLSKDGGQVYKYGLPDSDGLPGNDNSGWHWQDWDIDARIAFKRLWDSINAKRGFGWEKNPWVWVLRFHVFDKATT